MRWPRFLPMQLSAAHSLIGLALAVLLPSQALAQAHDPLAVALEAYAAVSNQGEETRASALAGLGPFEGEEVTAILLREAERARTPDYQMLVFQTIGQKIRPGIVAPLTAQLVGGSVDNSVQRACAEAIARQGNQGIDVLADIAENPPGGRTAPGRNLRMACLHGMSRVDGDRAWRVIAEQVLYGRVDERLEILALMSDVPNASSVRRAREMCLRDENPRIASAALRQLVEHGYSRASSSIMSLLERFGEYPSDEVRATMIVSMAKALTRDFFEPLLLQAAWDGVQVRQAIAEVAPDVAGNEAFVTWLVEEGLERRAPIERDAAVRLLAAVDRSELSSLLQPLLRRLQRAREDQVTMIVALHGLLAGDAAWSRVLLALADSSRDSLRTVGLDLLAQAGDPSGLSIAHSSLSDREWTVRSAAYEFCRVVRDPSSIPLLIARVEEESYRLKEELLDALEALTGRRFSYSESWIEWWSENEAGFQLPPLTESPEAGSRGSGSGDTISYYQIPLTSNRIVFVLDISGSMNARMGTDRGLTRLAEAKRQLLRVIDGMPADYWFNIIYFWGQNGRGFGRGGGSGGGDVRESVFPGLQKASAKVKERAREVVNGLSLRGGTDIYGAVKLAFEDPNVDTIYLLTDGEPTHGVIVDPAELAEEVIRWNHTRRIRIHGISVGRESQMLKRLAEESGGRYVSAR